MQLLQDKMLYRFITVVQANTKEKNARNNSYKH